jgi:hypothetical protein
MAEKWKAKKYTLHGKSRYDIATKELDIATVYEDAYLPLIIAVPLMLETLNAAREYVSNAVTGCRRAAEEADAIAKRDQLITAIDAVIAATK